MKWVEIRHRLVLPLGSLGLIPYKGTKIPKFTTQLTHEDQVSYQCSVLRIYVLFYFLLRQQQTSITNVSDVATIFDTNHFTNCQN